ncbi:MAG: hypothetical protein JXB48_11950 [Candidatus Latescibacteria bacterium]|nr:hypothetical protein [Candidatus Latescibacterota bacterium]
MVPVTEFRTLPVNSPEPADRTSEGTVLGSGDSLGLGIVDTTDEAQNTVVCALWWRVIDMNGNSEIKNIRVWVEGVEYLTGTTEWYMDITDVWTQGKTPVQVHTGTPGIAPASEPAANLSRMGGGLITGTDHDQTSRYIYIAGNIGVNETPGNKTCLRLKVKFDYE